MWFNTKTLQLPTKCIHIFRIILTTNAITSLLYVLCNGDGVFCEVGAEFYVTKTSFSLRSGTPQYIRTSEETWNSLLCSVTRHANCCHQPRLNLAQFRDWISDITSSWCTTDTGQLYGDHVSLLQHICGLSHFTERDEIEARFWTSCAYFIEIKKKVLIYLILFFQD